MMIAIFNRNFMVSTLLVFAAILAHAKDPVLSPSQLNANPSRYQNKTVIIRGFVTLAPEGHTLYESRELNDKFRDGFDSHSNDFHVRDYNKYCLTIANPGLMYRNQATLRDKTLTVEGTFLADYRKSDRIDLGACPLPTAILIDMKDLKHRYGKLLPNP